MENRIKRAIANWVQRGNKDFVIYPYGKNGKIAKEILNTEFGIQERYIVDNKLAYTQEGIYDVEYLKQDYKNSDFIILLAVLPDRWRISLEVHRQIDFVDVSRIADVLARSTYFNPWEFYSPINTIKWQKVSMIECISREIYKNNIQGEVAEAGVFQGQTARFINCFFPDRKLYLFDTFSGFDIKDQNSDDEKGMYNEKLDFTETSEELVMGKMHFPQNCIIKAGWFPESAKGVEDKFSFVRLDMDLYDPIYAGLEFFYPRMSKGGYIVVHDCRSQNFDGARNALIDFCKEKNIGYMCMPDNLGSAVINIGY